ncbi:MAG: hypothetical protein II625_03160 [Bacilli bacterium]|nr:hypothetical protein [Bacilli bacterium]
MKKKILIFSIILIVVTGAVFSIVYLPILKQQKKEKEEQERIANATIIVDLKPETTVSFMEEVHVSSFIENINGTIIDDYKIDTTQLGTQTIKFKYVNDEDITVPYKYSINVVDNIPPVIWLSDTKSFTVGTSYEDMMEKITCADNLDDNPKCEIIGDYDLNKVGKYNLKYRAEDASGNVTEKDFVMNVYQPSGESSKPAKTQPWYYSSIIEDYKKENTKIGIDVSSWQGDIDFQRVKDAGVEFVFIRVGSTKGINAEYFVDKKFEQNIKGFNEVGIPVGVYFYSYANSKESAIKDAEWVLEQIKGYEVELGVAYDWESWSFYNNFHQSFYSTTMNAKAFLDTVAKEGYKGLLYSSKNYLEKVWFPLDDYDVWLAHYTRETSYQGKYKYWQLASNGRVAGINGFVDVNIMYE